MTFRLETPRLILRDWTTQDWPAFAAATNTPAVMRWLGGVMDEARLARQCERLTGYARDHGHTFWAVERRDDGGPLAGRLIGFCGLKKSNQAGGPVGDFEIGWRLAEEAWGQGYAREAAIATLAEAFDRFAAPHVLALTVPGNVASWGLMERLGMTRRPELDFASAEFDAEGRGIIVYGLTRAEWQAGLGGECA